MLKQARGGAAHNRGRNMSRAANLERDDGLAILLESLAAPLVLAAPEVDHYAFVLRDSTQQILQKTCEN